MYVIGFCLVLVAIVSGQREGEPCEDSYSLTAGICTKAEQCQSAKRDFEQGGIRPTFCSHSAFEPNIVCCRDKSSILQRPKPTPSRPVWSGGNTGNTGNTGNAGNTGNRNKRVSERKCEEYSRGVVQKVEYIPLIQDPEALSVSTAKCDYNTVGLILGGQKAEVGEFPHMGAIGWVGVDDEYVFACGGSLISRKFVLTAGHCAHTTNRLFKNPVPVIVRLGDQNIDNSVQDGANPIDVRIQRFHVNPNYQPPMRYHDIALIELASEVTFRAHIRAACLWTKPNFAGYDKVIATGWGVTESRQPSKDLRKVALPILDSNVCNQLIEHNRNWDGFQDSQMCAGDLKGGKDTCQGDSGSPVQVALKGNQCIFYLLGVTSFGKGCGQLPGVYSRVSSYLDWIEQTVWPGEQ